ncbi:signal peptide peptidase SppA [Shewanella sp. AS1]|uniref:signal peptide peptidase SppA n=1 Tax=Shewanella sp. AS1 TaxID=2907626 RepID=UPI001F217E90|nr:signal peptide peptidase SppA [Shewanella sp. AS1]MCE9678429.1 signal peptide peptidase SppA [Shewanella sp. AS1]
MSAKVSIFKRIFSLVWKGINCTRKIILNLVFFGFLAIIILALTMDDKPVVESGSALLLDLSGAIVDQKRQVDPIAAAMQGGPGNGEESEILLADLLHTIDNATHDDRISAIVLDIGSLHRTGITKLQSVGEALNRFKASGKPIIANGNWYGQNQYLLASFADTIYLNPQGAIQLEGYSRYRQYYKSALDKLKIKTHVFRVGTFKSAVEPYIRDDMSPAAKEANKALLSDLWQSYQQIIAHNRDIAPESILLSADDYMAQLEQADGNSAQLALNMKLVDKLASAEAFRLDMVDKVGKAKEGHQFKQIHYLDYQNLIHNDLPLLAKDTVAIIVAKGNILNGKQAPGDIGGESTSALLRQARFDKNVKAVVLRVDSPGGSAFASEQIRQEILAIKAAGKPVVTSMSSYAASGGYWISASSDYIFANPTTLTGSIGIFGMVPTFEDSLAEIGVHTDGVATSDWSAMSVTRGLTPEIKQVLQRHIERGYHDFISLVATERGMSLEQVDKIAQGRVWSGKKALELGLVDGLGDLEQAVSKAAEFAKLDKFDTKVFEQELSPQEKFIQELFASASVYLPDSSQSNALLNALLGQWTKLVEEYSTFDDPNGIYLYCDTCDL